MGSWKEVQAGGDIRTPWLIYVDVWWKPTQYCKAIFLKSTKALQGKFTVPRTKSSPCYPTTTFLQDDNSVIRTKTPLLLLYLSSTFCLSAAAEYFCQDYTLWGTKDSCFLI